MTGEKMTSRSSADGDGVASSAVPERIERKVPLNFWFGPKKIGSARFLMAVEDLADSLLEEGFPEPPNLGGSRASHIGVYRPSERLLPDAPLLEIADGYIRYVESRYHRRFISFDMDFEGYLSKFSGKTRSTIRRKVRKFETASGGEIDWIIYKSPAEMSQFYPLARDISKLTYQEKLFDAGIPSHEEFRKNMLALAEADNVRGFVMFLEGKPISYLYLPVTNGRVIYGYLGFDPAFTKHSPGTVLQLLAMEYLFAENRYQVFDFTEGDGSHKRLFSTSERYCGNVFYLRPTIKNRVIIRLHMALRAISDQVDKLIEKSGFRERLRQALRGQRSRS